MNNLFAAKLKARCKDAPAVAAVYIDYGNICRQLKIRGVCPQELNLFRVIRDYLNELDIEIEFIKAYAEFDNAELYPPRHTSDLSHENIEVLNVENRGKNSGDIMLCLDAFQECVRALHTNIFIIVTCDVDFTYLIKKLKEENKTTILLSFKDRVNKSFLECAHYTINLDELFKLKPDLLLDADYNNFFDVLLKDWIWKHVIETDEPFDYDKLLYQFAKSPELKGLDLTAIFISLIKKQVFKKGYRHRDGQRVETIKKGAYYQEMINYLTPK